VDIEKGEERPVGIDDCAHYPLFTPDLLDVMRRHVPRARWDHVARSVIFIAHKPGPAAARDLSGS
jgi:hypothetical protein